MKAASKACWGLLVIASAALILARPTDFQAKVPYPQRVGNAIPINKNDIAGVVTSKKGPEAGVWVIAETHDFQTRYIKIVVTDGQGRYLLPDLPNASYQLWVRGYGLVDSPTVEAKPGTHVNLTAVVAPNPAAAAKVYPAIAWFAMVHLPTQAEVSHIKGGMNRYLSTFKNGACVGCHQLGDEYTRTIPKNIGPFSSSRQAWIRRMQSGQTGLQMTELASEVLDGLPYKYLSQWTDQIAAGALPTWKPPRPTGIERDLVLTIRDWMTPTEYVHDAATTDWRNPTVNPYGLIYGAPELSSDNFPILDPIKNIATFFRATVRDADTPFAAGPVLAPSPAWGTQRIWTSRANAHSPTMDQDGRVWYTARVRAPDKEPAYCKQGSDLLSAKLFPLARAGRQASMYDPKTKKYTYIDTCFSTQHLAFANDANNTLWFSDDSEKEYGEAVGYLNTKEFLETGDAAKSQGWTPMILDTNGNGKRDAYVGPDQPVNPKMDKRINADWYSVMTDPADGTVWGTVRTYPFRAEQVGGIVRLDPGPNPPVTALAEYYNVPAPGFGVRGGNIDSHGVVWVSLASGHLGEFDRSKCKGPLNGPKALGDQCPEGWTFYRFPGPGFAEMPQFSAEASYITWVDQHNTLGLGDNVPISTANEYGGLYALVNKKFVRLIVPYPLGFYAKDVEGRIDDPNGGWKGRGLWSPEGDRTPWHEEGGKTNKPFVIHFQMRPNPLAR